MKTITLKLTDNEVFLLDDVIGNIWKHLEDDEKPAIFSPTAQRLNIKISSNEILVQDVDKFREFLNDEIALSNEVTQSIDNGFITYRDIVLESILSKLNFQYYVNKFSSDLGMSKKEARKRLTSIEIFDKFREVI